MPPTGAWIFQLKFGRAPCALPAASAALKRGSPNRIRTPVINRWLDGQAQQSLPSLWTTGPSSMPELGLFFSLRSEICRKDRSVVVFMSEANQTSEIVAAWRSRLGALCRHPESRRTLVCQTSHKRSSRLRFPCVPQACLGCGNSLANPFERCRQVG